MAKYKIHMVKLGQARVGNESATGTALKGYFDRVIQSRAALQRSYANGAEVTWTTSCPTVQTHELLIYVVTSALDSIVVSLPGLTNTQTRMNSDGLTVWTGTFTAAEVYTTRFGTNPAMLAKLAFHEAMHNKTHRGNNLHSGGGLAASPITQSSTLTTANIRLMGGVLARSRPQWTGGCLAYNNPLRGMGL
ncbi:MAG: hypothetical protein WBN06_03580 [Lysobacterales bacterium]|jgi:hypothetical protein